jgi:HK97 family phage portal protein
MSIFDPLLNRLGYTRKSIEVPSQPLPENLQKDEFEKAGKKEALAYNPLALAYQRLNTQWGLRKATQVTLMTLRRMSRANWVDRACITTLRDEITSIPWDIVPINPKALFSETFQQYLIRLLKKPNKNNENWRTLIDKIMEDILVIDGGCVEKVRDNGGRIIELYQVDSATIKPVFDEFGMASDIAYQQFLPGQKATTPVAEFTNRDLIYMMWNPQGTVDTFGYGMSPVEAGLAVGTAFLYAEAYNLGFFRNNTIPQVMINMGKDVPPEQVDNFRAFLASEMQGLQGFHQPIVGAFNEGFDIKELLKSPADMQWKEYVEWQMKWKVALYRMSPQDIGFNLDMYKVEGQTQLQLSKNKAINSLKGVLKEYIDTEIIQDDGWGLDGVNPNLQFQWIDDEVVDPLKQAQIDKIYTSSGILAPNDIRRRLGEDPIVGGKKPIIISGANIIPLDETPLGDDEEEDTQKSLEKSFSASDAKRIGNELKVDWGNIDSKEFLMGLNEELEHSNITGGDPIKTAKIVLAHLEEDPKYYTKLENAMRKSFDSNEGLIVSLAQNATAIAWMDDRGITQPLFVTDYGRNRGFTVKSTFLDERREQEPPEEKVAKILRLFKVNTPEVKLISYDDVLKLIPPELYPQWISWLKLEPPFDSQEWRQRWGDTRKTEFYIVTGFINGRDLNNESLQKELATNPESFANAIKDLARVWMAEKHYLLGDRKPGHYIITKEGNGFGVDYTFYEDEDSWRKTSKYLPEILETCSPIAGKIFKEAVIDVFPEFEKAFRPSKKKEYQRIATVEEIDKNLALIVQKKILAWYKKAVRIRAVKRPLVKKAKDFNPNESYVTNGLFVYQNGVKYPVSVIDNSRLPSVDDITLNPTDYRQAFDYGVGQAVIDIEPNFPNLYINNPDLYAPMFEQRANLIGSTVNDTMQQQIEDIISKGMEDGSTYGEIADRLQVSFGVDPNNPDFPGYMAERIARTESQWAINQGMLEQYKEIGVTKVNIVCAPDACDDCIDAASDNPYDVSEEDILPIHCNCRCDWVGDYSDLMGEE